MAKELIWADSYEYVYGLKRDFQNKEEFIQEVKNQYEDGECDVKDIRVEPCICSEERIEADTLIPLSLTADVVIENYYMGEVHAVNRNIE
ncbi:MAG: hypothetical protein ACQEXX_01480 [Bacillota bacterium]